MNNGEPIKFLIVDDSSLDREKVCRCLKKNYARAEITEAASAEEAIHYCKDILFDVVIVDYMLPRQTGVDFIRELRKDQRHKFIPVILQTGYGDEKVAADSILSGANDYLTKEHISPPVLRRAVENSYSRMLLSMRVHEQQLVLKRSAEFKSKFLASMSHEIRTPLNAMLGMLEALQETELSKEQEKIVHTIDKAGGNLLKIINDILDLSKIEAGQLDFDKIPYDIYDLVDEVVALFSARALEKNIKIETEIAPEVNRFVLIDPHRVNQVLVNLIGNSIKFTEEGEIKLRLTKPDSKNKDIIQFEVNDSGIGIPDDKLDRIFGDFFQVNTSHGKQIAGTGLGLAISKQLVSLMDGKIWAQSLEGVGSQFFVQIPCPPIEKQDFEQKNMNQVISKKLPILVVDDDDDVRESLVLLLEPLQLEVYQAGSGKQALELMDTHKMGVVLSDINLPDISGVELFSRVRKKAIDSPFIFVSGLVDGINVVGVSDAEILGFLEKPVDSLKLVNTVRKALQVEVSAQESKQTLEGSLKDHKLKILLVDDVEDNQQLICHFLKNLPFEIDLANNGQEAINMEERKDYDLIFMDMQMPIVNGFEATQAIRQREKSMAKSKVPIIALSANAIKDEIDKSFEFGCSDYLTKPIKKTILLQKIIEVVNNQKY